MINLNTIASPATAILHLRNQQNDLMYDTDANGKADYDKPVTITLYGPGSKQWRNAEFKVNRANQGKQLAALRGKPVQETVDEKAKQVAERWAECTHSMQHIEHPQGAVGLYSQADIGFILDQVSEFASDWANFLPPATSV